jgi:hypothetical protein
MTVARQVSVQFAMNRSKGRYSRGREGRGKGLGGQQGVVVDVVIVVPIGLASFRGGHGGRDGDNNRQWLSKGVQQK